MRTILKAILGYIVRWRAAWGICNFASKVNKLQILCRSQTKSTLDSSLPDTCMFMVNTYGVSDHLKSGVKFTKAAQISVTTETTHKTATWLSQ